MTTFPLIPGLDGLLTLSRREGVDIRPTLLRVLTDLYVQTPAHTVDEERQFVALTSRLIDEVDDATRAAVRARLSVYSRTPREIADKLGLNAAAPSFLPPRSLRPAPAAASSPEAQPSAAAPRRPTTLSMQPNEASEINDLFFAADSRERSLILRNLESTPLKAAMHIEPRRAARAVATLEHMALEADLIGFTDELAHVLVLPTRMAEQIVNDPGGEPLACAARAIGMPADTFQRVLLFLDPELGASVTRVYTLSRLYDGLSERIGLIMLAAWRGANTAATRARYRPMLHDDERQRARMTPSQTRPSTQPAATPLPGSASRHTGKS